MLDTIISIILITIWNTLWTVFVVAASYKGFVYFCKSELDKIKIAVIKNEEKIIRALNKSSFMPS